MRRFDRWFLVVQELGRRLTTAQELAQTLGVSERTVYRDVAELTAAGVPIRGAPGVGYALVRPFPWARGGAPFDDDELEALRVGARVVAEHADRALAAAAQRALAKLTAAQRADEPPWPAPVPWPPTMTTKARETGCSEQFAEDERFGCGERFAEDEGFDGGEGVGGGERFGGGESFDGGERLAGEREIDRRMLATIRHAIRARRKLLVGYLTPTRAPDRREATRLVQPMALHLWGTRWTLLAWCEQRAAYRNFRVDRMARLLVTDESFAGAATARCRCRCAAG